MDIQKERELLKSICKMDGDLVDCEYLCVNEKWILMGARAAKAQAIKQFENFIDQAIEDSACADERRSLQTLLKDFQDQK